MKTDNFFIDMLSEQDPATNERHISSKRWNATKLVTASCVGFIFLCIKFGACEIVRDMGIVMVISGCALLGVMVFSKKNNSLPSQDKE